jgi:hypothetical protein
MASKKESITMAGNRQDHAEYVPSRENQTADQISILEAIEEADREAGS